MVNLSAILTEHVCTILSLGNIEADILATRDAILSSLAAGGTIFWMGNGGSAGDAQHIAAEFVGRYVKERKPLRSVALTTDTSILTAVGNDYGYDQVFVRQVEGLCRPGDVVVGISTSGNSKNVVNGLLAAKLIGATTVGLTGRGGGVISTVADINIVVPSDVTARVQEAHILIGHIICEMVDEQY